MSTAKPKRTEADLIALLRAGHGEKAGNGYAHAFVSQVRNAAGFDAGRTIDALAMGLWPSRGLLIDAFEIKCSRSDWQRELNMPDKAEGFARLVDRFWLVVADAAIVQPGELPVGWGLLVPHGRGLKGVVAADLMHSPGARDRPLPPGFDRSFLAALMRAATFVGDATPQEIRDAVDEALKRERLDNQIDTQRAKDNERQLRELIEVFEAASGLRLAGWSPSAEYVGNLAEAVRSVMHGDDRKSA